MLRADTTALFERLREAKIMPQEALSGSHADLSALENTLVLRVSESVSAITDVTAATGAVTTRVESNVPHFRDVTSRIITDLSQIAGHSTSMAANLLASPSRSNVAVARRGQSRPAPCRARRAGRRARHSHRGSRPAPQRFSSPLDESPEAASAVPRCRRAASEATSESSRAIERSIRAPREQAEDERRRTTETMRSVYDQTTAPTRTRCSATPTSASPKRCRACGRWRPRCSANWKRCGGDAPRARSHPRRTAPRRLRVAAGNRRQRRANAPRHRRPDRGAGRAQPHRRPSRPQSRRGRPSACRARGRSAGRGGGRERSRRPVRRRVRIGRRSQATSARHSRRCPNRTSPPPRAARARVPATAAAPRWLTDLLSRASRETANRPATCRAKPRASRCAEARNARPGTASNRSIRCLSISPA